MRRFKYLRKESGFNSLKKKWREMLFVVRLLTRGLTFVSLCESTGNLCTSYDFFFLPSYLGLKWQSMFTFQITLRHSFYLWTHPTSEREKEGKKVFFYDIGIKHEFIFGKKIYKCLMLVRLLL